MRRLSSLFVGLTRDLAKNLRSDDDGCGARLTLVHGRPSPDADDSRRVIDWPRVTGCRAPDLGSSIRSAFVRLRHMIASNSELAKRLDALEAKYDEQFTEVFAAIRDLMIARSSAKRRIGFAAR